MEINSVTKIATPTVDWVETAENNLNIKWMPPPDLLDLNADLYSSALQL
jgi:hypothetical protein